MSLSFLPSSVYLEAQKNNMEGKAGRVVVSWNRFARSLREAFEIYVETKQAELYAIADEIPKKISALTEKLPIRKAILAFLPYVTYLIFYSNYNLFRSLTGLDDLRKPNIGFLPRFELLVFHCHPHRLLSKIANPFLDCLAAIPYLVHFPLPAFFLLYLLIHPKKRYSVLTFAWCAGWVNLCALVLQYVFPTAPPWYVDSVVYGTDGHFVKAASNEAGFQRLDAFLGLNFFRKVYSASPLKFGAFPSLHVAWPAIICVNQPWIGKKFAWCHVFWISWAALYSHHHYGVDALAGILLVFVVNFCMIKIWNPFPSRDFVLFGRASQKTRTADHIYTV
eukprot:Seg1886.1 transcript_id=Seg1886.1/GoldUCD/mRNA.D3Y31 product="Inositol phosphorylceramide synthase catalytic subunit AUR1" pseudo=true protein_id=Seg1886.1/GoldUCD/D3Y31